MRIVGVVFLIICFSLSFSGVYLAANNSKASIVLYEDKDESKEEESNNANSFGNILEEEVKHLSPELQKGEKFFFNFNYKIKLYSFVKNLYLFLFTCQLDNPPEIA